MNYPIEITPVIKYVIKTDYDKLLSVSQLLYILDNLNEEEIKNYKYANYKKKSHLTIGKKLDNIDFKSVKDKYCEYKGYVYSTSKKLRRDFYKKYHSGIDMIPRISIDFGEDEIVFTIKELKAFCVKLIEIKNNTLKSKRSELILQLENYEEEIQINEENISKLMEDNHE